MIVQLFPKTKKCELMVIMRILICLTFYPGQVGITILMSFIYTERFTFYQTFIIIMDTYFYDQNNCITSLKGFKSIFEEMIAINICSLMGSTDNDDK